MNINDIYIPMAILTNYYQGEKILKKSKNQIIDARTKKEINNILKECKKEINGWYKKLLIRSTIILCIYLIFIVFCINSLNSFTEYILAIIIFIYIFSFIVDKHRKKDELIKKVEEYASDAQFVGATDIIVL